MESFAHREMDPEPLSAAERADFRWGLERVMMRHAEGTAEVRDLARELQRALRHLPVVMLHDRQLSAGLLVEHLAIGPGGVTLIAGWSAADAPAPLTVERLRGIFGARADLLRDGASADRTALVAPLLAAHRGDARADRRHGARDRRAAAWRARSRRSRSRPLEVEGIVIAGPRAVADRWRPATATCTTTSWRAWSTSSTTPCRWRWQARRRPR